MASQPQLLERLNEPMPKPLHGVYAITDATLLPGAQLLTATEEALKAGLGLLQYRNKGLPWQARCDEAKQLLRLCRAYNTPLLINDDVDLCIKIGADGVHLGQGDTKLTSARQRLGAQALVGITCHSDLELAKQAQEHGADYVAFGRFFPSSTKPNAPPASVEVLRQASKELSLPIVAIGGINAENGATLIDAGANMLAVIHYLFANPNISARVQKLNSLFSQTISR